MLRIFLVFFAVCFAGSVLAQTNYCANNIKSVYFEKANWDMSQPILLMNNGETLTLRFDLLADSPENLMYKIRHLTADFKEDVFSYNEYADGFESNSVKNRKHSFNSMVSYVHYWISFPNEDVNIKVSGNYQLTVYSADDPSKVYLKTIFYVVEDGATIDGRVLQPVSNNLYQSHQHLELSVTPYGGFENTITDSVKITILQNMRLDNKMQFPKPTRYNGNSLVFDNMDEYNFEGGCEYRHFEMKSLTYQSQGVGHTKFISPYYHIFLLPEQNKTFVKYQFDNDINGHFYIAKDKSDDKDLEADYVYVHFQLNFPEPILDGNIFLVGALTGQALDDQSKMTYNFDKNCYEKQLLLKQGYYNYLYVYQGLDKSVSTAYIEGSHYETENEYCIFAYFCPAGASMHRLIGQKFVNSLDKKQ